MPAERLQAFTGLIPRTDKRQLPGTAAQRADNVVLTSGRIDPIYTPKKVVSLSITSPKTIYRMFDDTGDFWLAWATDVNVARAIIADDSLFRIIITGDGMSPSVTDLALATSSTPYPKATYVLGVTPPITKPTVVVVGGAVPSETRVYVYTHVTQWGEESAPSPPSDPLEGFIDGSWNLSNMDAVPTNVYAISAASWAGAVLTLTVDTTYGLRAGEYITITGLAPISLNTSHKVASAAGTTVTIALLDDPNPITDGVGTADRDAPHNTVGMKKRIYRSLTAGGTTQFFFVDEIDASLTVYSDTVPASELGEPLVSNEWEMPPAEMVGVVMHPSGSAVGFLRNTLYFSEPGAPYAFPPEYQQSTDSYIVSIGVTGQSIVVGTQGRPYICTGTDPAAMSMIKREQPWPCLAKRGMVPTSNGVLFPVPLGLAVMGAGVEDIWTRKLYTQDEFDDEGPIGFTSAQYDDRYFATTPDGNLLVLSGEWGASRVKLKPTALYTDQANGKLYFGYEGAVWEWNASGGERLVAEWISKEFVIPSPVSLGAAKIDAENVLTQAEIDAINAANAAIIAGNAALMAADATKGPLNSHMLNEFQLNGDALTIPASASAKPIVFTLYVDGAAFYQKFVTDTKVFRLPARREYDNFYVGIATQVPVQQVVIGDSPAALKTA